MAILIKVSGLVIAAALVVVLVPYPVLAINPCDFAPAESDVEELNVKGDLQWFDDSYTDDRDSANTGSVEANFTRLVDKPNEEFGWRFDGSGFSQFNFKRIQELRIWGTGNYKHFVESDPDLFILGAGDFSATLDSLTNPDDPAEVPTDLDITAGGGIGRFRDVTVLSKAIRIQNSFLDQGILLGPFTDETLQEIAATLSDQDLALAERIQEMETTIEATGLTTEGNLGAKALLELEQIIQAQSEARLCGSETQASVGLTFKGFPPNSIRETFVLNWNFALVTDPVTQWTGGLRFNTNLSLFTDYAVRASISLARRLSENLRTKAAVTFTRNPDRLKVGFVDRWQLTTSAFFQISNQISITLGGEVIHETGYEEISRRISLQFNYDIF